MSRQGEHVILRTTLEVNGGNRSDGMGFQHEAATWAQDHLLPALEGVFASLPERSEYIVIDRLELELGSADAGNWGQDVLETLRTRLRAALEAGLETTLEAGEAGPARSEKQAFEGNFFRKLAHYLTRGTLPWNLNVPSQAALEEVMAAWLDAPGAYASKPDLVRLLGHPAARFRFRSCFSPPLVKRALALFFSLPEKAWDGWAADAALLPPYAGAPGATPPEATASSPLPLFGLLAEAVVETLAESGFACDAAFEARVARYCLSRLLTVGKAGRIALASAQFASIPFAQARAQILALASDSDALPPGAVVQSSAADAGKPDSAPIPLRPQPEAMSSRPEWPWLVPAEDRQNPSQTPSPEPFMEPSPEPFPEPFLETEGLFLQNAGLILIAPFLPALFGKLGLARKSEITADATSLALLHFLATGLDGAAEFQLALPKVLCGRDIRDPVDVPAGIPAEMKEEAHRLLASVIEHWAVLKNTSVDGLRESFLQRNGKLSLGNEGWLLQVEQKAFDMLLQHVPWTFGRVRLPWMKKSIRTEWVA